MWKLLGWTLVLCLLTGCEQSPKPAPKSEQAASVESDQTPSISGTISILAWNVESGGSDPAVIAEQLKELKGYDVVCLSEVDPDAFDVYANAVGVNFTAINGNTGRDDRLQIIFNKERFDLLETKELMEYRAFTLNNGTHRSPLYVRLQDKVTGTQFIVMTNHLARGNAELRKEQAIGLREWARDQNVAVINIGDFNLDFDFRTDRGNDAFPEMIRDQIFTWVWPADLIDTNWADRDKDGVDDYPHSMLDFAFVAGPAKEWSPVCRVIVREGDFPDDESTSDHRPIELKLTLN